MIVIKYTPTVGATVTLTFPRPLLNRRQRRANAAAQRRTT